MAKKFYIIVYILVSLIYASALEAQVSHGGYPLPLTATKSLSQDLFVEMPAFDVDEQLRIDSLNESDLRSGYHFAYKFMTDYTPGNSGSHFTTADGIRIWRLGIRSSKALSLNILFSEFELPEGASLFIYNADQSQVLGSFNYLNNSEKGILPVRPVQGDELIIEYQEPANVTFRGRLKVGEVNHGYRDFKAYKEPQPDQPLFYCMNSVACYQENGINVYDNSSRSVVLLIINGEVACTGTLLNNTSGDKKPYLLTASHCLNKNFTINNPDYEEIAGSIICFFNYSSPLCNTAMRGTEEMSVASAHHRAVNEQTDMALLELQETPPPYYQPFYSGWNAKDVGNAPYAGIHHPMASVKRINLYDKTPTLDKFFSNSFNFIKDGFWHIDRWLSGATAGGSSGSPLFDANNRVIGALTGGDPSASCYKPIDDYYYAISKSWEIETEPGRQLKYWLSANGNDLVCDGFDPFAVQPCLRLSNIREIGKNDSIEKAILTSDKTKYLFGSNALGTSEYAEIYKANGNALIHGAYIVNSAISQKGNLNIEINVYENLNGKPGNILHKETFSPTVVYRSNDKFQEMSKPLTRDQESYIQFSKPVYVSGTFFVGYKIIAPGDSTFTIYSLKKGETTQNTAWINYKNNWIAATSHPTQGYATSLFIDPVIQYQSSTANEELPTEEPVRIVVGAEKRSIHILLPETISHGTLELISTSGEIMQRRDISEQQTTLQIGSVPPGVYLVRVSYNNNLYIQKIIF